MTTRTARRSDIMTAFARRTGLTGDGRPQRYLWTDAFAVCNYLGLYGDSGEQHYLDLALALVDQVHQVLGRHRQDDARQGWISGLDEENGRKHPTAGGLRIGKKLAERTAHEPMDERLEWERDGQYYHYLTKWMHALNRVSQVTADLRYNRWALELARAAHKGFTSTVPGTPKKRMYWKMSIDLSRPLVASMGQHDALDGLVTFLQLARTAKESDSAAGIDLQGEIDDLLAMCSAMRWQTDDCLGIGGLLTDGLFLARLSQDSRFSETMLGSVLVDAATGLKGFVASSSLGLPPGYRLPFRELGLAIGLKALNDVVAVIREHAPRFPRQEELLACLAELWDFYPLAEQIEEFWLVPEHQQAETWRDHLDINSVMLATCLGPGGYLDAAGH